MSVGSTTLISTFARGGTSSDASTVACRYAVIVIVGTLGSSAALAAIAVAPNSSATVNICSVFMA